MNYYISLFEALEFENVSTNRWVCHFEYAAGTNLTISIDTEKRLIDYPSPIVLGDKTTSNFDSKENFVVLECVCRLLQKGYDPSTIILEKRYKLGHGASGGKSDITILKKNSDPEEQKSSPPLLIIECKTWGAEHDSEKNKTIEDGGQLFSYLQQDRSATHLCLYSSKLKNDKKSVEYRNDIISVSDSNLALDKFSKKEKSEGFEAACDSVRLYKYATNRESLHRAWVETYRSSFQASGIFEDDFTAYSIGYLPKRAKDLKEFNSDNGSSKVFNKFMEILRHNNVSDKENAFNRLCAIILAKLVDEEKNADSILDFQWFPNKDTPEDLVDRLQRLYKQGMKETLEEEVTYFEDRDIDQAFQAHKRDVAKSEIKKIFRALKFYTNNDFAFKEVHNKKLFEQNAQVVKEVVELFQNYRLKYTSKQAFLGNLFELLLNSGFKQSEGQFFTPIPIARFIVRCLPIRNFIQDSQESGVQHPIPKTIDYACGSAHFLTEIVDEIQYELNELGCSDAKDTTWTRDYIWGVEKDYRLARTAKIAMFLHGAGDTNIHHEDGLDHSNPSLPKKGSLDIVVANPPYSVKDFKQHLKLENNSFDLLPYLTGNSSEIESLFIERTAQLLKEGGVAGLILPASILSNPGIYQRVRSLILQKFLIKGVVELGGSAFIATGTKTIILFLQRRPDTHNEHFDIRADAIYEEDRKTNDKDFADSDLLKSYCNSMSVDFEIYRKWVADIGGDLSTELSKTDLFTEYKDDFEKLTSTKKRAQSPTFKKLTKKEQDLEVKGAFLRFCRDSEKEKFKYYCLSHVESFEDGEIIIQRSVVLKGAGSKAEEQSLLGYKWSQRRGSEGMAYLSDPFDGGELYSPDINPDSEPSDKAAYYFRRAFLSEFSLVPDEGSKLGEKLKITNTSDHFDFSHTKCELIFDLSPNSTINDITFDTDYELVPFNKMATLEYGKPLPERVRVKGDFPVMGSNGIVGSHNDYLINGPAIIVGRKGSAGKVTYIKDNCFPIDTTFYVSHNPKETSLRYIEAILRVLKLEDEAKALGVPGLNRNDVYRKKVPRPPLKVQNEIVEAIEALEKKAEKYVVNDFDEQRRQILFDKINRKSA